MNNAAAAVLRRRAEIISQKSVIFLARGPNEIFMRNVDVCNVRGENELTRYVSQEIPFYTTR